MFFLRASSHLRDTNNAAVWKLSVGWLVVFVFYEAPVESASVSSPLGEVFKAEAQLVVVAKQLGVIRNVGEKDLRHL